MMIIKKEQAEIITGHPRSVIGAIIEHEGQYFRAHQNQENDFVVDHKYSNLQDGIEALETMEQGLQRYIDKFGTALE